MRQTVFLFFFYIEKLPADGRVKIATGKRNRQYDWTFPNI